MFQLRRSAFRLLKSPLTSGATSRRPLSSFHAFQIRSPLKTASITFPKRWNSTEAQPTEENEDQPSVIKEEPSLEAEVENEIQADNAVEQSTSDASINEIQADNAAEQSTSDASAETVDTPQETQSAPLRSQRTLNNNVEPKSTVYVGNLFFDVTEKDLERELTRFGPVTRVKLIRDARGLSKGFGYVDFETIAAATKAIESMNQQVYEGRRLAMQYAAYNSKSLDGDKPKRESGPLNPPSKTLFIGNMSFEMTDRDLNSLFRGIKNVVDVRVAIDRRTGQPRGFAHADFIDLQSAQEAFKLLETKEVYGRKLRMDYSYSAQGSPRNRSESERGERGAPRQQEE